MRSFFTELKSCFLADDRRAFLADAVIGMKKIVTDKSFFSNFFFLTLYYRHAMMQGSSLSLSNRRPDVISKSRCNRPCNPAEIRARETARSESSSRRSVGLPPQVRLKVRPVRYIYCFTTIVSKTINFVMHSMIEKRQIVIITLALFHF